MNKKIWLVVAATATHLILTAWAPAANNTEKFETIPAPEQPADAVSYITSKTSKNPVKCPLEPVLIFRIQDSNTAFFAGSGSLFYGSNGVQIVTSEHLFPKENGSAFYGYRPLRTSDPATIFPIESIMNTGQQIAGDNRDVVILKVGALKAISGFSVHNLETQYAKSRVVVPIKDYWVTSLVSGEKVRVFGAEMKTGSETDYDYLLLDYQSMSGESGTGFVDKDGGVVVLKGTMSPTKEHMALLEKTFGKLKGITMALGPLKPVK